MRSPNEENKYNIKPGDIKNFKILNLERLHREPFWRNNVVRAWCLSGTTCETAADEMWCDGYWIGFFDDDAKEHAGKIRLSCTSYGGMCGYNFKKFYDEKEIENESDLKIQEMLLGRLNWLIDEGIVAVTQ